MKTTDETMLELLALMKQSIALVRRRREKTQELLRMLDPQSFGALSVLKQP